MRGVRILLWVEAGDVDQRITLVGELERMVIARVLLKALEARIDGWISFFTVISALEGVTVQLNKLGKRTVVEMLLLFIVSFL